MAAEIQSSMTLSGEGGKFWQPDKERVSNVLLKLARGHLHDELSIQEGGVPTSMDVFPLAQLEPEQRNFFECPDTGAVGVWPELGSRAFLRLFFSGDSLGHGWQNVQEGRYRYLVGQGDGNYVHVVIGEYLGVESCGTDFGRRGRSPTPQPCGNAATMPTSTAAN